MRIHCPSCGHTSDLDPAFAGRKVLCAVCECKYVAPRWEGGVSEIVRAKSVPVSLAPIDLPDAPAAPAPAAVPAPSPAPVVPAGGMRGVANLRGPDPRAYLKAAVEKGYVSAVQAERLRPSYEAHAAREAAPIAFGEFLVERGFLTADENRSLLLLLDRGAGKKSVRAAALAMLIAKGGRECPNCFEVNVPGAAACRYCTVALAASAAERQCPNCFASHPAAAPRCAGCGADMGTGLIGDRRAR